MNFALCSDESSARTDNERNDDMAKLFGLVLAGGESRRMGQDKAVLSYHAEPQVVHAWRLLQEVTDAAYVSARRAQLGRSPYRELPAIADDGDVPGPAAGLVAASRAHRGVAWLVLAVDMPLVDRSLLEELIAARDPSACGTAFRRDDGTIEPLCAIWEPAGLDLLEREAGRGKASPRRVLENHRAALVPARHPAKLASVNTPEEFRALLPGRGGAA